MNGYIVLAVLSLALFSLFSLYVGIHLEKGVICSYVYLAPYVIPISYVLGFLFGYAIPQISRPNPKRVLALFEGDEKFVLEIAFKHGTQAEVARKLGRVRAHRLVKELERRGLVERVKKGATYQLKPGSKIVKLFGFKF